MDLTDEQVHDLWLQYSRLYPDRAKGSEASFHDDEFEEFEKELAEESAGVLYETTELVPYGGETAPVYLSEASAPEEDEWEDV